MTAAWPNDYPARTFGVCRDTTPLANARRAAQRSTRRTGARCFGRALSARPDRYFALRGANLNRGPTRLLSGLRLCSTTRVDFWPTTTRVSPNNTLLVSRGGSQFSLRRGQSARLVRGLAFARRSEDLDYSSLVVPDHFDRQLPPLLALAAAAAVTTRIRLGTIVLNNDVRQPAALAKEARCSTP